MPTRLTLQRFISKAIEVHGEKYGYDKVEYKNNSTKVIIICPAHGEFWQTPNGHTMGQGCPKCKPIAIGNAHRKPREEFITEAIKVHGNRYDYSLVDYKNGYTKVKIICPIHGIFEQVPKSHLRGSNCFKCSYITRGELQRQTSEEFIETARRIHQNKYDYNLVKYEGRKKKIKIICPIHGAFMQSPSDHIFGPNGCPKCGDLITANTRRLTQEEFIKRCKVIHGDKYDYSLVKFGRTVDKIRIICPKHDIFEKDAGSHLYSEQGCPICKSSKGELKILSILTDLNINFEKQKTFPNCKNRWKLRFDFYFKLNNQNFLIEYDGQQHFDGWNGINNSLAKIQRHDSIKTQFAQDNGFTLIRIPYTEFDNIEAIIKAAIS